MKKKSFWMPALLLALLLLAACGNSREDALQGIPFAEAVWDLQEQALREKLGEPQEEYASVYGGNTAVYPMEYLGASGTVKYMFADDGKLASIAWAYVTEDSEELAGLYRVIDEQEASRHGKSEFSSRNSGSYGDVWYLHDCDILISTIFGSESCGLQYAYIRHEYSKHK